VTRANREVLVHLILAANTVSQLWLWKTSGKQVRPANSRAFIGYWRGFRRCKMSQNFGTGRASSVDPIAQPISELYGALKERRVSSHGSTPPRTNSISQMDQLAASGCCLATSNPDFDLPNSCYRPMCRDVTGILNGRATPTRSGNRGRIAVEIEGKSSPVANFLERDEQRGQIHFAVAGCEMQFRAFLIGVRKMDMADTMAKAAYGLHVVIGPANAIVTEVKGHAERLGRERVA